MAQLLLSVILALLFGGLSAGATTIQVMTSALDSSLSTGATNCDFSSAGPVVDCTSDETATVAPVAGARGIAKAFADITTGELKVQVTGTTASGAQATEIQQTALSVNAQISIFETLTVAGDGTLSVTLAYDGDWDVFAVGTPNFTRHLFSPTLVLDGDSGFTFGNPAIGSQFGDPIMGAVDSQIDLQIPVQDGDSVTISSTLQVQIVQMQGTIDYFSTGSLTLEPSTGVSLTFSDPDFLSQVPEPGTALLVSLGLFALALQRRNVT